MNPKLKDLQSKYPELVYETYSHIWENDILICRFKFALGEINLQSEIEFHGLEASRINADSQLLDQLVFQVGLFEIPTYWKLACSPTVVIESGSLSEEQVKFWEKLLLNGMGEFFYVNQISPITPHLVTRGKSAKKLGVSPLSSDSILIPVGGGKDSIVTMELLAKQFSNLTFFTIGDDPATESIISLFSQKHQDKLKLHRVHVVRRLDPQMSELNRDFFNGHTPFSSVVAMGSILAGSFTGSGVIALSNESSANQMTGFYEGLDVNHQYSKTVEFERDFRKYMDSLLTTHPDYFSFLRPLGELQIAKLFSGMSDYFSVFRSCNVGKRTNTWCGQCAKCLFVYLMLSVYLDSHILTGIFGQDLLNDITLLPLMNELLGKTKMKPFECVGTVEECRCAVTSILESSGKVEGSVPVLIAAFADETNEWKEKLNTSQLRFAETFLPNNFQEILKHAFA